MPILDAGPALPPNLTQPSKSDGSSFAHPRPESTKKMTWRAGVRWRVLNFTPSWFAITMGTGITSILIKNLPYQFAHQNIIANTIFALNVLLFVTFTIVSFIQYLIWPTIWTAMLHHPTQSLFLGTFPMGLTTIVSMVAFTCVPAFGDRFATLALVLWWITAALSVIVGIGFPFIIHSRHLTSFDQISGLWFLPIVTNVVTAATGGIVATSLSSIPQPSFQRHARTVLVMSYILWGTGVPLSFILMPLYYARLAVYKLPPAAIIVSVFLPIGPCGQGAFGILELGKLVRKMSQEGNLLPDSDLFTIEEMQVMGSAIYGCSIIVALVLWGVGLFWLVNAVLAIGNTAYRQTIPFNMGWWGFTFPLGVFATATTSLASSLDSAMLKVLGTVLSSCEVLLWLFVSGKTIQKGWEGSIFFAPYLDGGEPPRRSSSLGSNIPPLV